MLQGLPQFSVPLLDLLKQPDVLDGDDRLVGEGFEKRNLFVCKRPDFLSMDYNRANQIILF